MVWGIAEFIQYYMRENEEYFLIYTFYNSLSTHILDIHLKSDWECLCLKQFHPFDDLFHRVRTSQPNLNAFGSKRHIILPFIHEFHVNDTISIASFFVSEIHLNFVSFLHKVYVNNITDIIFFLFQKFISEVLEKAKTL